MAARAKARRARKQSPTWWKWTKRSIAVMSLGMLVGASILGFLFFQQVGIAREKIATIGNLRDDTTRQPSYIYASDGTTEIYHVSAEYRTWVPYEKIPKLVKNAILAAEDKRFFEHQGIDPIALGRTLFTTVKSRSISQGGSTLTMQLAKLLYSNSERTFKRKLSDMAMAYTMEQNMTKEEIFEFYANKVYFGSGAYGVQAAAKVYFGKTLDKLTVGEAALLARLVRRPSDENPFRNPEKAIENRDVVLGIMRDEAMITQQQYDAAKEEKYDFKQRAHSISEQFGGPKYFIWHVLDVLHDEHPEIHLDQGGYKIYTTIDMGLQRVAEDAVRQTVHDFRRDRVTTAAFVAMDGEGKILCEVGGVDFKRNQYNVVKDGLRQPGSSFKPFVYATAFATGAVSVNDMISNEPFTWEIPGSAPWRPRNDGHTGGSVSVQTAFKLSINIPAARVMEKTGPNTVLAYCRSTFGFTSPRLVGRPSMCLGAEEVSPLEMAQAYSVFMLRGNRAKPYCITRIVGPDGAVVAEYEPQITKNVLDPNVTDQIDALMRSVITSGTGTRAGVVPDARGKTGTTSENKDAWFCGYTDGIVGIGWVANEIPRKGRPASYEPMASSVFGGKVTVYCWAKIMKYAQAHFGHPIDRPSMRDIIDAAPSKEVGPDPNDIPLDQDGNPIVPTNGKAPTPVTGNPGDVPPPTTGGTDPGKGPDTGPPSTLPPTTNPNSKPPVKPPADPPKEDENDYVTVEVCADTGMRASIYCPETVTRKFRRGTEPRKRCTKHGG